MVDILGLVYLMMLVYSRLPINKNLECCAKKGSTGSSLAVRLKNQTEARSQFYLLTWPVDHSLGPLTLIARLTHRLFYNNTYLNNVHEFEKIFAHLKVHCENDHWFRKMLNENKKENRKIKQKRRKTEQ